MGHILQQIVNVSEIPLITMEYIGRGGATYLKRYTFSQDSNLWSRAGVDSASRKLLFCIR